MKYVCDKYRHLICVPYSIENLHTMAEDLDIKRCWFHKNHYDIPKKRVDEIRGKCVEVDKRVIVEIIRSPENASAFLSEPIGTTKCKPINQELPERTELKYNGYVN